MIKKIDFSQRLKAHEITWIVICR